MSHNTGIFWPGNTYAKFFWLSVASVTSVTVNKNITALILSQYGGLAPKFYPVLSSPRLL
jgi:hypothetical protein